MATNPLADNTHMFKEDGRGREGEAVIFLHLCKADGFWGKGGGGTRNGVPRTDPSAGL